MNPVSIDTLRERARNARESYIAAGEVLHQEVTMLDEAIKADLAERGIVPRQTRVIAFDENGERIRETKLRVSGKKPNDVFGVGTVYNGYIGLRCCRADGSVGDRNAHLFAVRVEKAPPTS